MTPLVIPKFLTAAQMSQMNAFIDGLVRDGTMKLGIEPGPDGRFVSKAGRYTTTACGEFFAWPQVVASVRQQITERLGLDGVPLALNGAGRNGVNVSCTYPGSDIYVHIDPMQGPGQRFDLLRCNVITRASDEGGELVVDDQIVSVCAGDLHCYLASRVPHGVRTVGGSTARVQWMFSYWITESDWLTRVAAIESNA